ncbi:extracellular solute-binding protein [uncultured Acetatifactor sp.]|uniref:extracellular solute-binding protein n=1 Tax=uncultured Acetatifactor sp. TaxID=1671927 RepID=UPI00262BC083|nr:extracellular solute-binding protein [uncultured Acetatifactor sp.]
MAKKRTLKLLSIVCAAVFFTGACGSGGGDASSNPSGSQQESKTEGTASGQAEETPSEEASESAANDQAADNDGLITITTVVGLSDAMQQYIGVKDDVQTNNSWYNGYEKDLGIHVENLWSVPGSQYQDKLNAQISAGDIPDVFNVNSSQLKTLVDNGMVMELTDLFEQNASDFTREMMEADDYTALEQCKMNGGLYALPNVGGNHDNVPIMWIRRDWMEKLDKKAPTTLAELEDLAQAFVSEDPDGNGQDDTYGIALSSDVYGNAFCDLTGIMEIFGAHSGWVEKDGKAAFGLVQPEMKSVLETVHRWYESGIIDQEFIAKDTSKVSEDVVAGKVGITFGSHGNAFWPFPDARSLNPDADWMPYPIPGLDGALPQVMVSGSANGYYVISIDCEHPEAVMDMYNYFYQKDCALSPDYDNTYHITGVVGDHPEWAMDWAVLKTFYPQQNLYIHRGVKAYLEGDESQLENSWVSDNAGQVEAYMNDPENNPSYYATYIWSGPEGAFSVVESYEQNNQRLQNLYTLGNTEGMAAYNVILDQLIRENYTKMITGDTPVDSFDDFAAQWASLGGEQITREVNELIGR